ncbi:pilus biogenesis protein [Sphaerisporangium siamense]|uniref:Putative nucleic acid-binding protein n=1 Tax=Sphaerisporangium siamense TaxID=795645 RepID=A0A7W7D1L1_9ACTN|nr:PIN domain-containing protein [Sphaerisporangium siamense]MBB4698608.1 putative nucleic acid-binding protein [Sphaerisporangium siamense]GII85333.1 pilus biogenesis protein [Sphaerisporangium siamense]
MIVVDTGPIVAATFQDDKNHQRCVQAFMRLRVAKRPLLVPSFVAGESCYMLGKLGGSKAEAAFLRLLESGWFRIVDLTESDLARIAVLVERYHDLPLGAADASVVAVAERMRVTEVATVDVRHFSVVRPVHTHAFTLIPA